MDRPKTLTFRRIHARDTLLRVTIFLNFAKFIVFRVPRPILTPVKMKFGVEESSAQQAAKTKLDF